MKDKPIPTVRQFTEADFRGIPKPAPKRIRDRRKKRVAPPEPVDFAAPDT